MSFSWGVLCVVDSILHCSHTSNVIWEEGFTSKCGTETVHSRIHTCTASVMAF